jgi:1-acyl-sn-glycerol-3-phosphate acyltransferase
MRTLCLLILYVLLALLFIPLLLVCFVLRITAPLFWYARFAISLAPKILGISVIVKGRENADRRLTYVYMANHQSFMDGPLLLWLVPHHARIIFKKVLSWIPVIGQGMRYVRFVPVDRRGTEGGKAAIKHAARQMRDRGFSFIIFPEGTRSLSGRMGDFRRGGFYLALDGGVPILPITIAGTFDLMPKGRFRINKGNIRVTFHPAVSTEGFDEDSMPRLMALVRARIREGLNGRVKELEEGQE